MKIAEFFNRAPAITDARNVTMDSPELRQLFGLMSQSQVTFLTGKAGTGKSTLTREVMRSRAHRTALLASTGIAAFNVTGQTIDSLFGFSISIYDMHDIPLADCPNVELFRNLDLIVIDEISMVRADKIDRIDRALRSWRDIDEPFGGVQLLLIGDCFQLGPIVSDDEEEIFYGMYNTSWWFGANVFQHIEFEVMELTKSHRHPDPVFETILDHIRENNAPREYVARLNRECFRDIDPKFTPDLVLTCTNAKAEHLNKQHFESIRAPSRTYQATIEGRVYDSHKLLTPASLTLKVGLQVMVTKNIREAVNGTIGHVVALHDDAVSIQIVRSHRVIKIERTSWDKVRHTIGNKGIESKTVGRFKQIPLTIGKAVTIHKSQGLTLDNVEIDLGKGAFAAGQTYVALSRCKSIKGLKLTRPISMRDVRVDGTIVDFYAFIREQSNKPDTSNIVVFPEDKKAG